jgi:exportin-T
MASSSSSSFQISAEQVTEMEQIILCSNDPTNPVAQRNAAASLHQWESVVDASTSSDMWLELLQSTHHDTVRFYSLTTLSRLDLSNVQFQRLREYIFQHADASMPVFLRNKAASVLSNSLLSSRDFQRWRNEFVNLATWRPHLFLQTIICVLDEFQTVSTYSDEKNESIKMMTATTTSSSSSSTSGPTFTTTLTETRAFKDLLKGYRKTEETTGESTTTLLQNLFGATTHILEMSIQSRTIDLQLLSLKAITAFFQWTEVAFLGDSAQRCLDMLLYLVASPSDASSVRKTCLQTWQEWVTSSSWMGKSSHKNNINNYNAILPCEEDESNQLLASSIQSTADGKLQVLPKLLTVIHETNILPYQKISTDEIDAETMEVVIQMAQVINAIGIELLPLYQKTVLEFSGTASPHDTTSLETLFCQTVDLFFRAFAYDDIDVALAVLPFATRITVHMEEDPQHSNSVRSGLLKHLTSFINTLYDQMKYPVDFAYDYEDENDAEEENFRNELCKVYVKLVRTAPKTCLQFICEAVSSHGNNLAIVPAPDLEAIIRLLYHYCEGIRPSPGLKVVMHNTAFCELLRVLHNSNIAHHPHREVLCLYYETAVRYYPIFLDSPQLLQNVLSAMAGRGLQHEHARVRSRCCYLILRLVKSVVALLDSMVETAVAGIQNLLSNTTLEIRPDDKLYLFETIGLLLGKTKALTAADQKRYLLSVMTPHVRSIEEILSKTSATLQQDADLYGEQLALSIAAITHLSKGFSKPPIEVQTVLMEALNICMSVLNTLPNHENVRSKSMVLLQRMIQCIGKEVLPTAQMFVAVLVTNCTSDDILFVSQIFNQLCTKFKQEAVPAMDAVLLHFLQKCQSLIPAPHDITEVNAGADVPPHLRVEQLSIQKLAYSTLQHIVTHNATLVLVSPTNARSFETVLQMMNDGAVNVDDPIVRKTCIRFFRELCSQWISPTIGVDPTYRCGLLMFVCQTFIPGVFCSLQRPTFDPRDANQSRVVSELAKTLSILKQEAEIFVQCVSHLQQVGLRLEQARALLEETPDVEKLEAFLNDIFNAAR